MVIDSLLVFVEALEGRQDREWRQDLLSSDSQTPFRKVADWSVCLNVAISHISVVRRGLLVASGMN